MREVRIASSVLSASNLIPFIKLPAESTLEALHTQGGSEEPRWTDSIYA